MNRLEFLFVAGPNYSISHWNLFILCDLCILFNDARIVLGPCLDSSDLSTCSELLCIFGHSNDDITIERVKHVGVSFFVAINWMLSFAFMECVFYVDQFAYEYMTVFFSIVFCLIWTIAFKFILPETRCKSRQEIMNLL